MCKVLDHPDEQLLKNSSSELFLTACREKLRDENRRLVVLTNFARGWFGPPITQLLTEDEVRHIPVSLFGTNCRIMEQLISGP